MIDAYSSMKMNPAPSECIQVHPGITVPELRAMILSGELMLPAVQTSLMALHYLGWNGHLRDETVHSW
jgi:hypothetical protein